MKLCMCGHSYRFELENICRLFLPQEPVTVTEQPDCEGLCAVTVREVCGDTAHLSVRLSLDDFDRELTAEVPLDTPKYGDECELALATLLYRFSGTPEVNGDLLFSDAHEISGYAENALIWATQNGILNGVGNDRVAPGADAQRAQVAAMMARFIQNAQ